MSSQITNKFSVLVAGPLPPPLTGMILVTQAVLEQLSEHYPTMYSVSL